MAVVAGRAPSGAAKERIVRVLDHRELPCPARKLELVVYERARLERGDVRFELDLNTGPDVHEWRSDPTDAPGHWYVIDVAIGRERALTVSGPPPDAVFPEQPRGRILEALRESLDWHVDHAGESAVDTGDLVLNAWRAWHWLEQGEWCPKAAAGRWAAARCPGVAVERALARRAGEGPPPPVAEAIALAREVRRRVVAQA